MIMLQVFAPNIANELWSALSQVEAINPTLWDHTKDVFEQKWPQVDADSDIDFGLNVNSEASLRVHRILF